MRQEEPQHRLQAWLAEFSSGRDEIQNRSQRQSIVVQLHAAAAVAIIGFAAASLGNRWAFLLVVPLVSATAWLWYRDHEINIQKLARYEREVVRPVVVHITLDEHVLGWHEFDQSQRRAHQELFYLTGLFLIILGPTVAAALVLMLDEPRSIGRYLPLLAGVVTLSWLLRSDLSEFARYGHRVLGRRGAAGDTDGGD